MRVEDVLMYRDGGVQGVKNQMFKNIGMLKNFNSINSIEMRDKKKKINSLSFHIEKKIYCKNPMP